MSITTYLLLRAAGRYLLPDHIPHVVPMIFRMCLSHAAQTRYPWAALLAVFGSGHLLLNRPMGWLSYCIEAVYPWYILHPSLIAPLAFLLVPLRLVPVLEPMLVLSGTVMGCLVLHAFVIRRIQVLRPLFGLK